MAKLPFMRVYVNDLFGDTVTLSDAEFGSYVAIFMAMWKAGGWLTLDQARKASRVTAGRWLKRWAALAGYFEIEADGRITMQRVRDDLNDVGKLDDRRSKGVSAETRKRAPAETTNSEPKPLKNNNPTSDPSREGARRQKSEPDIEAATPSATQLPRAGEDWPDGGVEAWELKLAAVSGGRLDPAKEPNLTITRGILAQWHVAGLSFSLDVLPVVQGKCRKQKRAISSWMFFNAAVREAHERRLASNQPRATFAGDRHDHRLDDKLGNFARAADGARAALERKSNSGVGGFGGD